MALGAQLPRSCRALFADLRALKDKAPSLYAAVSEVRILAPDASAGLSPQDLDLLLYLTSSPVPVRARGSVDESLVKYALMILDLLSRQGVLKDIQELDFRSGDVVYKRSATHAPGMPPGAAAGSAAAAKGG